MRRKGRLDPFSLILVLVLGTVSLGRKRVLRGRVEPLVITVAWLAIKL